MPSAGFQPAIAAVEIYYLETSMKTTRKGAQKEDRVRELQNKYNWNNRWKTRKTDIRENIISASTRITVLDAKMLAATYSVIEFLVRLGATDM
jgi:hypothetical protein